MEISRYNKQGLNEIVVSYIKRKILSGEFKSGDKLVESEISTALSISRAPVREAMRELNVQGMVSFIPRKGNYVLEMSLDETLEVFDIRIALEKQILEVLITQKKLQSVDFDHLNRLVDQMASYEKEALELHEKIYLLNHLDLAFHGYVWEKSGSLRRSKILEDLFYQLLIIMNRNVDTLGTFHEKAEEHSRILNALQKNNLSASIHEFTSHISSYIQAITDEDYVFE